MAANFEVVELPENQLDVWDRLHSTSEQATLFSSSEFSRALGLATGKGYRFLVCLKGETPVAGLPVHAACRVGVRTVQQPPLVPHLGLTLSSSLQQEHPRSSESVIMRAVQIMSEWLARRFDYVSLSHHPSLLDVRPLMWQGYRDRTCYTYRIDLSRFSMDRLHSSVRKQVAKGGRAGLKIEESKNTRKLIELVGMSYRKHGRKIPFSERYLEVLFRELSNSGKAALWYVSDREGRVISGRMLVKSGDVVYDWVAGADPALYESGSTSFLLYHLIEGSREGHRTFDLMGANTPSIAIFKSNFGGVITPYHLMTRTLSFKGALGLFCHGLLGRWRNR